MVYASLSQLTVSTLAVEWSLLSQLTVCRSRNWLQGGNSNKSWGNDSWSRQSAAATAADDKLVFLVLLAVVSATASVSNNFFSCFIHMIVLWYDNC